MAFNFGIAAGAFNQAADLKDLYSNFIKAQTTAKIRQAQQIKPGDIIGTAPPTPKLGPNGQPVLGPNGQPVMMTTTLDPTAALKAAGYSGKDLTKLLGQNPDAINAALAKAPNANAVASVQFYTDPETGKLSATNAPIRADKFYGQALAAQAMISSGLPDYMAQGQSMLSNIDTQRSQEQQINQQQRQMDIQSIQAKAATDPAGAVALANQLYNKDFSDSNTDFGYTQKFNYDPTTNSITTSTFNSRGMMIGSPSAPIPFHGSADGTQMGWLDQVTAAATPDGYQKMRSEQINANLTAAQNENGHIEAMAALAGAQAQGESAAADVARANIEASEEPGVIAANKAQVANLGAKTDYFTAQTNGMKINQANQQVVATAQGVLMDPRTPTTARAQVYQELFKAGKLPPALQPLVPNPQVPGSYFVQGMDGTRLGTMDAQGNITPTPQIQNTLTSPYGKAIGATLGALPGGGYGVMDAHGNAGMSGNPMTDAQYLYQAGVAAKQIAPVTATSLTPPPNQGFLGVRGGAQPAGVNGTVPGAAPAPMPAQQGAPGIVGPSAPQAASPTYTPPVQAGGVQYGLGAAATSGMAGGPVLNGQGAMYAPAGPGAFGNNTGMGAGLAGGASNAPAGASPPMSQDQIDQLLAQLRAQGGGTSTGSTDSTDSSSPMAPYVPMMMMN
jgi:hypothetical protein